MASPELYPGERLVVGRKPLLAAGRARMREALLAVTEVALDPSWAATTREHQPLRGQHNIAVRIDRALRKDKVGKHFDVQSTDESCSWERSDERIAQEAMRSYESLS